jgi:hypothetical protein
MKELIAEYNAIPDDDAHKDEAKAKWRVLVASLPEGFCLSCHDGDELPAAQNDVYSAP